MSVAGRLRVLTIIGLVCFGLAGLMLHYAVHPPLDQSGALVADNLTPLISGLLTVFLIPLLFSTGRHSAIAQLLNLIGVAVGVIAMSDYMLEHAEDGYGAYWLFIGGTLADSLILLGRAALGQLLYEADLQAVANRGVDSPKWQRLLRLPIAALDARLRLITALGLALIGLGGALLHLKVHFPYDDGLIWANLTPQISVLLSVLVVPALFMLRKTAWAQLLNGMTSIVGIIAMTHYWIATGRVTLLDSLILVAKWALGQALFEIELDLRAKRAWDAPSKRPAWWRFQRTGWWLIHLAAMSAVYAIGVALFG